MAYVLDRMRWRFLVLLDLDVRGPLLLISIAASVVGVLLVLREALRRCEVGWVRWTFCGVMCVTALSLGVGIVEGLRSEWLGVWSDHAPGMGAVHRSRPWFDAFEVSEAVTSAIAVWAIFIVLVIGVAARRVVANETTRALIMAAGAVIGTAACATLVGPNALPSHEPCGYWDLTALGLRESIDLARGSLRAWTFEVLAIGLVALVVCSIVAVRDARRGIYMSRRLLRASLVLLGLGVATFAVSRSRAADARVDVPHRELGRRCAVGDMGAPITSGWCEPLTHFLVSMYRGGSRSVLIGDPRGLVSEHPITEAQFIEQLRRGKAAWFEAGKGNEFVGVTSVLAEVDTPLSSLRLDLFLANDHRLIYLGVQSPPAVIETASAGTVRLWPQCCGLGIRLDPGGEPSARYATYGELVRAADVARLEDRTLVLAP